MYEVSLDNVYFYAVLYVDRMMVCSCYDFEQNVLA